MGKLKHILLAGSVLPSLILGQPGLVAGEVPTKTIQLAQALTPDELLLLKKKQLQQANPVAAPPKATPQPAPQPAAPPKAQPPAAAPAAPKLIAPAPVAPRPAPPAPVLPKPAPPAPVVPKLAPQPAPAPVVQPKSPFVKPVAPAIVTPPAPVKPVAPIAPANSAPLPKSAAPVAPPVVKPAAPNAPLVAPAAPQTPAPAFNTKTPPPAPTPAPAAPNPAPPTPALVKPVTPTVPAPATPAPATPTPATPAPGTLAPAITPPPATGIKPVLPAPGTPVVAPAGTPNPAVPAPATNPAPGNTPPPVPVKKGINPSTAAAIGAGVGLIGGFIAGTAVQHYSDVQHQRQQVDGNGYTLFREPGRTIIQQDNQYFVQHDETERFRNLGDNVRTVQRGDTLVTVLQRPNGFEIVTITDLNGRLLRRIKRFPDGREIVLIDNTYTGPERSYNEEVVYLAPPPIQPEYVIDAGRAPEETVYQTLIAPPLAPLPRHYTLDEVRLSPDLRNHMRSVDLNTINFESGSWAISPDQANRLSTIAQALLQAIKKNPSEVYLVEGYTDAVGAPVDNLSLSDRRAQAVATTLTQNFGVPPENLTSQGYGEQFLKVQTQDASRENRRVTLRRITPLLNGAQAGQ